MTERSKHGVEAEEAIQKTKDICSTFHFKYRSQVGARLSEAVMRL